MAFTASFVTDSVMGKYRTRVYNVTADGTAGNFNTGLPRVTWAMTTIKSMASFVNSGSTRHIAVMAENVLDAGTAAAGYVALTGTVSGDVYRVIAFGPS